MAPQPDFSRVICRETNVRMPAGLRTVAACDITAYYEQGSQNKGVIYVLAICSLNFKNGTASSGGGTLTWTSAQKTDFMTEMRKLIYWTWSDKHRITTASVVPAVTDYGVIVDVRLTENMSSLSHSHWNLDVKKVDAWDQSSVYGDGGGFAWNGKGNFDSQDVVAVAKASGHTTQRAAVHEFGHMIGLRDEYPSADGTAEDNPNWLPDIQSVMHSGETVRDRHYAMLADWMTKKHSTMQVEKNAFIDFKVNGTVSLLNAKL